MVSTEIFEVHGENLSSALTCQLVWPPDVAPLTEIKVWGLKRDSFFCVGYVETVVLIEDAHERGRNLVRIVIATCLDLEVLL